MAFMQQQNSIKLLSSPNEKTLIAQQEKELKSQFLGPQKANDGLHLTAEHPVITRDMPEPGSWRKLHNSSPGKSLDEVEREVEAWNNLDVSSSHNMTHTKLD